jgi:hypothetical protein
MLTEKPKGIVITVRDRKQNKSKSITIYNTTIDEVFKRIEKALK